MKKPQEKAEELVYKFKKYAYYPKTDDDELFVNELNKNAKQCALLAVAFARENSLNTDGYNKYLDEVKQEIEK